MTMAFETVVALADVKQIFDVRLRQPLKQGDIIQPGVNGFRYRFEKYLEETDCCKQRYARQCQALFNLFAVTFPIYAPGAEMLAVVAQEPIPILSQSGASPLDSFLAAVLRQRIWFDPNLMARSETGDADFLHRAAMQRPAKPAVMQHLPLAYINTMVAIAMARRDEMRAWLWFGILNDIARSRRGFRIRMGLLAKSMLEKVCHCAPHCLVHLL
jgi:hypothetical protein